MVRTCVDSTLAELPLISRHNSSWAAEMMDKIQSCKLGLRFLRMVFWSSYILEQDSEDDDVDAKNKGISIAIWGSRASIDDQLVVVAPDWLMDVQARVHQCKQTFQVSCHFMLQRSVRCKSFKMKLVLNFIHVILKNLNDIIYMNNEIVLLGRLEKKLRLLRNLLFLIPKSWRGFKEMREFKVAVHAFAHYSASIIFLYWAALIDEERDTNLNPLLFNVLQKIQPCVPLFKDFYFRFLEEMKLRRLDSVISGQIVQTFIELILENLVDIFKDDFQSLQQSLAFVLTFLVDPPSQQGEDRLLMMTLTAEIEALVKDDLYLVLSVDRDTEENFSKANECLRDFMRNIEPVKGKIQQVYDQIPDSFSYDFPKTNGLGFFDFLLQNLGFLMERKLKSDTSSIPFAKHLLIKIEEELKSLRPYLDDLFQHQKEREEVKNIWLKVIDLAYQTEYAMNSCLVTGHPLWYNMARLMDVLDKLKDVNNNLKKIEGRKTHDGEILHCSAAAPNIIPEGPSASGFNEVMVGLEEEADKIVENLTNGTKSLEIVAIVGMPGLGKTTMANKVYNNRAVRNHFHTFAYCVVSQVYSTRKILFDILGGIRGKDDSMHKMTVDDLAHMLRKCLLGKRFLIVMDDIWDVNFWNEIKSSLPDQQKGSRVIFTTRNRNVALLAKKDCILHDLCFLSEEESWELLRKKAFQAEGCPPEFLEVGKMIAFNCKGLPLTIVLIAGLLTTDRSLRWWNKISETVSSHVLMKDAMSVLELSYQHLPEHLKPCFLYFGAFVEDAKIRVNKLTLLWIAEGFVLNSKRENLEDVAREYLNDLVGRSLVIANKRSSYGGIKSCRIHDLVHEFCQRKAQEENIFQLKIDDEVYNPSGSTIRNPYRLCINMKEKYVSDATDISSNIHSLLVSSEWKIRCRDRDDLSNLKLVQVMDLEDLDWHDTFIREMRSAVHLRFMAISFFSKGPFPRKFTLDNVISNRWNLEILILSGVFSINPHLPEAIWNLTRLRHVDFIDCDVSVGVVRKREAYLYPRLVNLESFSSLWLDSTEDLELFLQRSPSLRKLSLRCTPLKHSIHFPELDSLSRLESLKVVNLGKAGLRSFNHLSSLKKLSLTYCRFEWRYLPVISKMPCLEVLKLLWEAFVGPKWDMEDTEFPKLKYLKLENLILGEWIAYPESFPRLEVLIVRLCERLETIPPCFGKMVTLKRIQVHGSESVVASVVEIQEAQKDFGNEELLVISSVAEIQKAQKDFGHEELLASISSMLQVEFCCDIIGDSDSDSSTSTSCCSS